MIRYRSRGIRPIGLLPWASADAVVNGTSIKADIAALRQRLARHQLAPGRSVMVGVSPGPLHAAARWAVWQHGAVLVPVFEHSPPHQLADQLRRTDAQLVVADSRHSSLLEVADDAGVGSVNVDSDLLQSDAEPLAPTETGLGDAAQLLFTSGTTGRPKIVRQTHGNIAAQIASISRAWRLDQHDHILHCLPLHHIHGIVNALEAPLWAGARVTMLARFQARAVWEAFRSDPSLNVFMAVPVMYAKLIEQFDRMEPQEQEQCREACRRFRLMISGSASLHESILRKWEAISGHVLLERYGMTETGMILSNPLDGVRKPGYVGKPMPGVQVKVESGDKGDELLVKGPGVFHSYLDDDTETQGAFDPEGYFRTGDIVTQDADGDYRIVGRSKTDILKTAGFKVSCLEIEHELLGHPDVVDCAVVGLPNVAYGDIIAAVVQLRNNATTTTMPSLKEWLATRLPPYKLPRRIRIVDAVPKNVMSKNDKAVVRRLLQSDS